MRLPRFEPGKIVSAKDWNAVAREVNRIWATETGPELTLTKGMPWRIRAKPGTFGELTPQFNGPVWQIYVWRPDASSDYQLGASPSAVYLTGPFTQVGGTSAKRLAKLTLQGGRTRLDSTFAAAAGFEFAGAQYLKQPIARCFDNDRLLVLGVTSDLTYLDGERGVFFGINESTGERAFSPWASVESVVPGYRNEELTGVASNTDTIAVSAGILSGWAPGVMLFDTSGNPVEVSAGNYLYQKGLSSSYLWVIANAGTGYIFQSNEVHPFVHSIQASAAGGVSADSIWNTGAGTGIGASSGFVPTIDAEQNHLILFASEWNGTVLATIESAGIWLSGDPRGYLDYAQSITGLFEPNTFISLSAGPNSPDIIFTNFFQDTLYIYLDGSLTQITTSLSGGFHGGPIVDAKYFRTRNDGTHQIIVAGEFASYKGEPVPYIVFIDEDGNRLADLEWA